ncbi:MULTISPECIES: hypothetical protein [unclassified Streptomyces]|uniref:hypothetical protein n=1 Tax=unclassified Streptomyces TaxID=2593676 RepID=UPI00093A266A|nr:hypothetical protein [Streptomyces sp. CB02058]OKI96260.1 hypothetical protein AMK10_11580 [Streptomyces sp. CB02058]
MHTTATSFTLHPWTERPPRERPFSGWRGTSPEFGDIQVRYPVPPHLPQAGRAEARGGFLPVATFESRGVHMDELARPTLNGASLRVGDAVVHLSRNRWAPTRRGRSLHMRYLGDRYRLTAINRRDYVLTRSADSESPGAVVTVTQSGFGKRKQLTVRPAGRTVPADIALAALFSGVDRAVLTRRGAVRAGISRMFSAWAGSQ